MAGWSILKAQRKTDLPEPPASSGSPIDLKTPAGRIDGRRARHTGRVVQFNTKVRPEFLNSFDAELSAEAERVGRPLSKAYFLELLLAVWRREKGKPVSPFGLSDVALKGAEALCTKTGWNLSDVIEDAIAARCRELGLAGGKEKSKK